MHDGEIEGTKANYRESGMMPNVEDVTDSMLKNLQISSQDCPSIASLAKEEESKFCFGYSCTLCNSIYNIYFIYYVSIGNKNGMVSCMLCTRKENSVENIIRHCQEDHQFSVTLLSKKYEMKQIDYVK